MTHRALAQRARPGRPASKQRPQHNQHAPEPKEEADAAAGGPRHAAMQRPPASGRSRRTRPSTTPPSIDRQQIAPRIPARQHKIILALAQHLTDSGRAVNPWELAAAAVDEFPADPVAAYEAHDAFCEEAGHIAAYDRRQFAVRVPTETAEKMTRLHRELRRLALPVKSQDLYTAAFAQLHEDPDRAWQLVKSKRLERLRSSRSGNS